MTGKGLSTNDYTDADKTKLSGIEAQANKTTIDSTLSNAGQAADAKAAGDAIAALQNYIASMDVDRNATGNPATFSDAKAANVKSLSVTLTPTQSGSGTPSLTNVRPISGVSSVTVTRTGENGVNSQSVTVSLVDSNNNPLTVYGGTLDVTAGTLTVTHKSFALTGTTGVYRYTNWDSSTHYGYYTGGFDDLKSNSTSQCLSDKASLGYPGSESLYILISAGNGRCEIRIRKDLLSEGTNAAISAWLAENPVQLVGPLENPVTYQLTPQQLATLAGYNAVSANAGNVTVTYKADASLVWGGAT